ncbi:APC family permease [Nonomuraea pusilla]|uniref:Amino acid/polyamine/organocation transporter, APC superfamily n=1 Tax=Nonomuraea pusilla TaxID=46177 RepID=A0A1H8CYX2_9ACTN|nr:APC family permease [Nonomuraea pusilla]SEN00079.1 amino acid/polyamine/organocation transporter, APC superfamily [Nonomuraea pusilla]
MSLARNAIGTADLVFFVVAAAAPLTVMAGVAPFAIGIGGVVAPLGYLLSGIVVGLFAAGFTAMSAHVRNAGAFYAYIGRGLGKVTGLGSAYVAVISYNLIGIGLMAAFGVFASSTVSSVFGLDVPWQVWTLLCVAAVGVLGYLKITLSARVLGVALVLEVLILLVFEGAVLLRGGSGLSLEPFNPAGLLSGGAGGMFVLSIGAFIGFEATAIYAEEARDPRRTVPRATYAAVAFLAVFYTFTVWMIISAYGTDQAVAVANGEGGADMVFTATSRLVGTLAADVMHILIVTSCFAAALAFHNASTRYFYALGREGVLPRPLARISRNGSPAVAVAVQVALSLAVIAAGMAAGSDPYDVIFLWTNGTGIIGVMALQALAALAVVVFFRKDSRGYGFGRVIAAPFAAFLALGVMIVLVIKNFDLLTAASPAVNTLLILPVPVVFAIGAALAWRIRRRDSARYALLTTIDVEETAHA